MFDIMSELSQQYFETGSPHPDDIMIEYIKLQKELNYG